MNWLADSKPSFPGDFSGIVYAQIYQNVVGRSCPHDAPPFGEQILYR
jgi:hypothetical protein